MLAGETIEHPWLGIAGDSVTATVARQRRLPVQAGALVESVVGGSPAEAGGLRAGDVLVAVNGAAIDSMDALGEQMDRAHRPGDTATFEVVRDGKRLELPVTLGAWPAPTPAPRTPPVR